MNIVVYNGSTMIDGNLDSVAEILLNILKGNNVTYLKDELKGCANCRYCLEWGECYIKDSFPFKECVNADVIIILSPIFFFDFSSKTKAFIDRLYSVSLENKLLTGVITSGSSFYLDSGIDIVDEIFYRITRYCGAYFINPLHIVTEDRLIEIDENIIENFVELIEEQYNEIKKNRQ